MQLLHLIYLLRLLRLFRVMKLVRQAHHKVLLAPSAPHMAAP